MRFAYLATAMLSLTGIIATPTLSKSTELDARADGADPEGRTFFGCSNYNDKHQCQSKGGYWEWSDNSCCCECSGHGPSDCAAKGKRWSWDASQCTCCDNACDAGEKHHCLSNNGKWNDHECVCSYPPPPDPCQHKKTECSTRGWGCHPTTCECLPPKEEPCKDWLKALICYKLGKKCDKSCNCW